MGHHFISILNRIAEGRIPFFRHFGNWLFKPSATNWSRVIMSEACERIVADLDPPRISALEISGERFKTFGFRSYQSVHYPEFDICTDKLDRQYDLIIAEQVFEHLLWPYRAAKNVFEMLSPEGFFLISTPFLVKMHNYPVDCSRWTPLGLKHFLAEAGFPLDGIQAWAWGNRACVVANFDGWVRFRSKIHSLVNEEEFPYHVWALARKNPASCPATGGATL
jgi:hypothetical protein